MAAGKGRIYLAVMLAFATEVALAQTAGLPQEASAREAADAQLQSNINAEAAARSAADTRLQNSVNDETAARALGEARVQGNIDAEAAARAAADDVLRRSVESEAGTRAAADVQLQNQIDALRAGGTGGSGGGGTATVDCASGQTVAQALAAGADQIVVRGTCRESVTIIKDGVTLTADPAGGRIDGPDANVNTVQVMANRVTIDGLTVSGGRNGITGVGAASLNLRNCTVQSTGRTGIAYANGSSGTVDGCAVQSSGRDGIAVDGAQATIINSTVTSNTRTGVLIINGATARVGLTERLTAAANTITQNGSTGISVVQGSQATIAMNTITDNGTNPSLSRQGILVSAAVATISGGNTISRNAGQGVFAGTGASVQLGDPGPGLTTVNTISANGNNVSPGGVFVFLGSTMVVRDAVIELNNGPGLAYSTRSQGQVIGSTIRNNLDVATTTGTGVNTGDGIRLFLGSTLLPATPTTTISGNAGFGFQCQGNQSIAVNTFAPFISYSGNARGDLSGTCAF